MALNMNNPTPIKLGDKDLKYVDRFTYLGSVLTTDGGADKDIHNRLAKGRTAFRMLDPVWRLSQNQDKAIQELCGTSFTLRSRMLEND